MARPDRLDTQLEAGFTALEAGRLDDAAVCLDKCRKLAKDDPDVVALAAAIAEASGDVEAALASYRKLVELRPDDPLPRICIARLELNDLGDPDAALDTLDAAFDFIDDEQDLVAAVMLRAEALIATDDHDGARTALAELSTSVIEDHELALELAELALAAEDTTTAVKWIDVARRDEALKADALHLLGRVFEANDQRKRMIETWQEVRKLDAAAPDGDVTISEDELERIALAALHELPADVRDKLERVPILIDDRPSAELVADGVDPRLLGLFSGSSMADGADVPSVTNILLFKKNLERIAHDLDELAEEVRITVLHETAHYFGLDEDDLVKLGLD